jgi:hypothetical protein
MNTFYDSIKAALGTHLTLDNAVPAEVGCAEAMSALLRPIDPSIPANGIANTADLLAHALAHPEIYTSISDPEEGALVIFATGSGNGSFPGHTGAFGADGVMYVDDWGVCSNDSNTGLFRELWAWLKMLAYYQGAGGMQPHLFRIKS